MVNKFPRFYGTRRFIIVATKLHHEIHFSIMLTSMPRSPLLKLNGVEWMVMNNEFGWHGVKWSWSI